MSLVMPLEFKSGFRYRRCISPGGSSVVFRREKLLTHKQLWTDGDSSDMGDTQVDDMGDTSDEDDDSWEGSRGEIVIGCIDLTAADPKTATVDEGLDASSLGLSTVCASPGSPGLLASSVCTPKSLQCISRPSLRQHLGSCECEHLREQLRAVTATVADLESQLLSAQKYASECEAKATEVVLLRDRVVALEGDLADRRAWPVVTVCDVEDGNGAEESRHIRLECPGVGEDAIDLRKLPNGVRVRVNGAAAGRPDFEREFHYDHREDGCFELRMNECNFDNGILLLVLRRTLPQRMRLHCPSGNALGRSALIPVLEDHAGMGQDELPDVRSDLLLPETPTRLQDASRWDWPSIEVCADSSDANIATRGTEFYMLSPFGNDARTPGSASVASEVPSELWLCPQGARGDTYSSDAVDQPLRRDVVEQPHLPRMRILFGHDAC